MSVYVNASFSKATGGLTAIWSDTKKYQDAESDDGLSRIVTLKKMRGFLESEAVIDLALSRLVMHVSTLKEVAPQIDIAAYKANA